MVCFLFGFLSEFPHVFVAFISLRLLLDLSPSCCPCIASAHPISSSAHSCTQFLQNDTAVLPAVTSAPSTRINYFSLNTVQGRAIYPSWHWPASPKICSQVCHKLHGWLAKLLSIPVCQVRNFKMWVMDLLQDSSLSDRKLVEFLKSPRTASAHMDFLPYWSSHSLPLRPRTMACHYNSTTLCWKWDGLQPTASFGLG